MNENLPAESSLPDSTLPDDESETDSQAYRVQVANEQAELSIDEARLISAVELILAESEYPSASVSIAVVDDPTIHALNVQYLEHDYPTDVLSFVLEDSPLCVEGELIVSADTAIRASHEAGWSASDELLLYVIHGALHLVGYDDHQPVDKVEMYAAEAHYLQRMAVSLPGESSRWQEVRKDSQS